MRKGTLAHEKILAAYFNGMTWGHDQKVMIFDLVPNRPLAAEWFNLVSVGCQKFRRGWVIIRKVFFQTLVFSNLAIG